MSNLNYTLIPSPLDQFEIRNLLSLDAPMLGNLHISLTNIGLYLTIGGLLILTLSVLTTNYNKIVSNNWSISQESLYATVHSIVTNQINPTKGQIYFPFIYTLFIFILINNLIGMVSRSLRIIINKIFFYYKYFFAYKTYAGAFHTLLGTGRNRPVQENNKVRLYSTTTPVLPPYNLNGNNSYYLNPYYITGFVDAEGCFTTSIFKDSRAGRWNMQSSSTKWQVKPIFSISLHNKDIKILDAIQRTWGVGKIYTHGKDSVVYRVSSLKNLRVILNHFWLRYNIL